MHTYLPAQLADCENITALHAASWRQTYRGILSDDYLDRLVEPDRYAVWAERLLNPSVNQHILLAEAEGRLLGFICLYTDADAVLGTLIDNLHIGPALTGRGIGAALLREGVRRVMPLTKQPGFYLYVYEANVPAIGFYEHMGGVCVNRETYKTPGGGRAMALCYGWKNADAFTAAGTLAE